MFHRGLTRDAWPWLIEQSSNIAAILSKAVSPYRSAIQAFDPATLALLEESFSYQNSSGARQPQHHLKSRLFMVDHQIIEPAQRVPRLLSKNESISARKIEDAVVAPQLRPNNATQHQHFASRLVRHRGSHKHSGVSEELMTTTRRKVLRTMAHGGIGVAVAGPLTLGADPFLGGTAQAQQQGRSTLVDKINANTLMILTAGSGLTFAPLAADLATVLNDGDNLRILPVQGYSAFQNVRDVRYLRGIDMGFTRTNILGHWRRTGEIPDLNDKIVYIFKLCNEEENIIVRDPAITAIEHLRGKKVNFNQVGSGTQMSARDIFSHFKVEIEETNLREGDGLQKLKDGEIAGLVATAGKPSPVLRGLKEGFHIVPIPFNAGLIGDYAPSTLTHEDYPNLIPEGQSVDTLSSGIIVIAYNWPKNSDHYRRIDKFVNAFFPHLADFQKPPRHEKWKETILAATIPGVKRFEGAEEWIKNDREQELNAKRDQFKEFLATRNTSVDRAAIISDADRTRLFEDFMKWMKVGASR